MQNKHDRWNCSRTESHQRATYCIFNVPSAVVNDPIVPEPPSYHLRLEDSRVTPATEQVLEEEEFQWLQNARAAIKRNS